MGLDMWLYTNSRKVCEDANDQTDEWEGRFQTPRGIAICWRKANAIHNWFVAEVQGGNDDCGIYDVSINQLARLYDTCKTVIDSTRLVEAEIKNGLALEGGKWVPQMEKGQKLEDPTVAMELLPTSDGFFFGSTDYDQWYWWDLQFTMNKLDKIMENLMPADGDNWYVIHKDEPGWYVKFQYSSSW